MAISSDTARFAAANDNRPFRHNRVVLSSADKAKPRKAEWSEDEHVEIERLRVAYPAPRYEVECSHTDEGDPWCIVHDHEMGVIVLHIARIDGSYVLARGGNNGERYPTIAAVINLCSLRRSSSRL